MACFIYDGVDYSKIVDLESIEMPALPTTRPELRYAAGRDGAHLADNRLEPLTIKLRARLATECTDPRDIQRKWAEVASMMRTDQPRPLSISEGLHYMAVLADQTQLEFKTYTATTDLQFICADPVAYGTERKITVPSGGSVTFNVAGTYRARPAIAAQAVRSASSLLWGVRLDDADFIHVETGGDSARDVRVDCAERTCTVAGAASLITLDSDWLELEPGQHTLAMDNGTGAAAVTFRERWL